METSMGLSSKCRLGEMEKELKRPLRAPETDFLLQWGSRKRLRCVKTRDESAAAAASPGDPTARGGPRYT
ncbi:uncharacterized protein M6B38_156945 [Iris pallida]|uniref:Uncharacterized protein n=1 Tax=Iris pallida TaxID=29817 RepID=A0AAX6F2Z5_IRIPA|nr:uncharacterized protein M6B38_156945 [Iris pallida]